MQPLKSRPKDEVLLTLVMLRLNIPFESIVDQFNCTQSSIVGVWSALAYHQYLPNPAIQVQYALINVFSNRFTATYSLCGFLFIF